MNSSIEKMVEKKLVGLRKTLLYTLKKHNISYQLRNDFEVKGERMIFRYILLIPKEYPFLDEILVNITREYHKNFINLHKVTGSVSIDFVFKYEFSQKDFRKEKLKVLL